MMKRNVRALYIFIIVVLLGIIHPGRGNAGVDVHVNIGFPPPIMIHAEPELVLIPRTNAYIIPDVDIDILFHNGYWYRPHKGYWYRADSYNGPWISIVPAKIPVALLELPPDYRRIAQGQNRVPYGKIKNNWKEKVKHGAHKKHKKK